MLTVKYLNSSLLLGTCCTRIILPGPLGLGGVMWLVLANSCERKYHVTLEASDRQNLPELSSHCHDTCKCSKWWTGPSIWALKFTSLLNFGWFNIFSHFWKPLVRSSDIGSAPLSLLPVITRDMNGAFLQQMFTTSWKLKTTSRFISKRMAKLNSVHLVKYYILIKILNQPYINQLTQITKT